MSKASLPGVAAAVAALAAGDIVGLPTETVYGLAADASNPEAIARVYRAKGRPADHPLIVHVLDAGRARQWAHWSEAAQRLADAFWPGPLTLIFRANPSLAWDLGDTKGTVAVRMPMHQVALDLLRETGPMAVSSANRSGQPPATTVEEAEEQLGDSVAVYLDGGPCADNVPSTIVDLTTAVPRLLRKGAIPVEKIRGVVGYLATED